MQRNRTLIRHGGNRMNNQDVNPADLEKAKTISAFPLTRASIKKVRQSPKAEIIGSKNGVVLVVVR